MKQLLREQDVNLGDRTVIAGAERKTLAWMNLHEAGGFTVYADARLKGPPALVAEVYPLVVLEWGHGGASMASEHPIIGKLRVPVAASMISLEGRLVDRRTGAAPSGDVSAEIAAFIAKGTDGETLLSARTVVSQGSGAALATSPQRVLSVQGHNGGIFGVWIMLFDATIIPADGAIPRMAIPAPSVLGSPFASRPAAPRDFVAGVSWAASSTPLALTRASGAAIHLEVDFLP